MSKTEMSNSVTVRVPVDVLGNVEAIAEATGHSKGDIIVRALRTYLLNEGFDILAAIKGREQIAAGEYEDIDDVIADMDRIIAYNIA